MLSYRVSHLWVPVQGSMGGLFLLYRYITKSDMHVCIEEEDVCVGGGGRCVCRGRREMCVYSGGDVCV